MKRKRMVLEGIQGEDHEDAEEGSSEKHAAPKKKAKARRSLCFCCAQKLGDRSFRMNFQYVDILTEYQRVLKKKPLEKFEKGRNEGRLCKSCYDYVQKTLKHIQRSEKGKGNTPGRPKDCLKLVDFLTLDYKRVGRYMQQYAQKYLLKAFEYLVENVPKECDLRFELVLRVQDQNPKYIFRSKEDRTVGKGIFERSLAGLLEKRSANDWLIWKEKVKLSCSGLRLTLQNSFRGEWEKVSSKIKECKNMIKPSLYVIYHPYLPHVQIGLIKNPVWIVEEFSMMEWFDMLKDSCEYIKHADIRRNEIGLVFKDLIEIKVNFDDGIRVRMKLKIYEMSDASELRRKVRDLKFLLGYMRVVIKNNPLDSKGLKPFKYLEQELSFFENVKCLKTGYSQIIENFENTVFCRILSPSKNAKLRSMFVDLLKKYSYLPDHFVLGNKTIKIESKFEVLYLLDLMEVWNMFWGHISGSTTKLKCEWYIPYFTHALCIQGCEPTPVSFTIVPSLQYKILKRSKGTECYNQKIPRLFKSGTFSAICRKKNGESIRKEALHRFRPREKTDREFFLESFFPTVLFYANLNVLDGMKKLLDLMIVKGMLVGDCYCISEGLIVYKGDLTFFNQKTNLVLYEKMGDVVCITVDPKLGRSIK